MNYRELFNRCLEGPWITAGDDVQYKLEGGVLYFQYTASDADWLANFDFPVVPYRDMKHKFYVHRGFLAKWKSVREVIRSLDFHTIVGFSQGAALAALACEDRWFHTAYEPTAILFGCPRFLWLPDSSARLAFCGTRRVSLRGDLVTHLPPLIFGYQHVGQEEKIGPWSIIRPKKHDPEAYRKYIGDSATS